MHRIITLIIGLLCVCATHAAPHFSLITFYPGEEVYQLEGHTGLRLQDPEAGIDRIFNWGVFDFNAPNFLYRFVKGETDYILGVEPTEYVLPHYAIAGRKVVEQDLDLDSAQSAALLQAVMHNLEYERVYRYNYVLDNCATRPLRLIENSLGDGVTLKLGAPVNPEDNTFRKIMRRYHRKYPWYQFGIDLALGSGIDKPITPEMSAFAPADLEVMLQGATTGANNKPLVKATRVLYESGDATLPATPWYLTPMTVAVVVLLVSGLVLWASTKGRWRVLCNTFRTILFTLAGIDGLVTTFLVFVSEHEATSPNWLLLWLNPLWFVTVVTVWMRPRRWATRLRYLQCLLIVVCALLGIFGVQSYNPAFYPLMLATLLATLPGGLFGAEGVGVAQALH